MSRVLPILSIVLYVLTLSQAYVPHVNYWMNRDFIASELCENRDRPELKCEGKCHLKKEIQRSDEDQKEGKSVPVRLMVEFFQPAQGFQFSWLSVVPRVKYPLHATHLAEGHFFGIFHPPQV